MLQKTAELKLWISAGWAPSRRASIVGASTEGQQQFQAGSRRSSVDGDPSSGGGAVKGPGAAVAACSAALQQLQAQLLMHWSV